jgi:hypothetical protein
MLAAVIKSVEPHPTRRERVVITGTWSDGLPNPDKCPRRLEQVREGRTVGVWVLKTADYKSQEVVLWRESGKTPLQAGDQLQWRASSSRIPLYSQPPPKPSA